MKIYNETKTQELQNPDLRAGYLKSDKLFIRTEPAVTAVAEQGHYETVAEYPNGGKDVQWAIDTPAVAASPARNIYEDIQVYVPHTPEQIEAQNKAARAHYMDAYRKYQASVNYGEFERVPAVDKWVAAMRNKEWGKLSNPPPVLKYFAGECGFADSGLKIKE